MKTNGARFLESLGIPFELREYDVDPDDLTAITVAKKIGMPAEQVFKTLLVTGGPDIYRFAVVPGDAERFQYARAVGLHSDGDPGSNEATRPARRVSTQSAMGAASSRW